MATAKLEPTRGNAASGTATFQQIGSQVTLRVRVEGLKPGGEHGFHIHEKGDCSSGDGMSTGGHFNPSGKAHGAHDAAEHHAGDLPSLKADASGRAEVTVTLAGVSIGGPDADIVGRGLIVHANPDDFKTQPTGNSGARIACGVIVRS
jgi:Cu-Zn family superoxide dismutase